MRTLLDFVSELDWSFVIVCCISNLFWYFDGRRDGIRWVKRKEGEKK